jgi:hypothetical protein
MRTFRQGNAAAARIMLRSLGLPLLILSLAVSWTSEVLAHAVAEGDKGYIQEMTGVHLAPFVYLGAKHMVTGYDHLLFLAGVIFFLYRLRDIGLYVSLFALRHSTTMLLGVYFNIGMNAFLIAPGSMTRSISLTDSVAANLSSVWTVGFSTARSSLPM